MRYIIIPFFLFCFICRTNAQSITWEKQFHYNYYNSIGAAIGTEDSGFFLAAGIGDTLKGALWLVKLNKHGNEEWRKIIDSNGNDLYSLTYLIKKESGVYILLDNEEAVYNSVKKTYEEHQHLTEFNINGNISWVKDYNVSTGTYYPYQLLSLDNGNYILDATYDSLKSDKMLFQKFDRNHRLISSDSFNFGKGTGGGVLLKTRDNKILIGGDGGNGGINNKFSFLLLLDTNGKQLNYVQFPYIFDSSEHIEYMQQLKNGNIVIESSENDFNPIYFTITDSNGNLLKKYSNYAYPDGTGGFITDGDSILVFGGSGLLDGPLNLTKFDNSLKQIQVKTYDDTFDFYNGAGEILRTSDGGLLLCGTRQWYGGPLNGPTDMVAIKLDAQGNLAKTDYSGVVNIRATNNISIYPNPAIDNLYINVLNGNTSLKLEIFDGKGSKVISNKELSSGNQSVDVSYLSKGLYLYRLYNNEGTYNIGKFVKE